MNRLINQQIDKPANRQIRQIGKLVRGFSYLLACLFAYLLIYTFTASAAPLVQEDRSEITSPRMNAAVRGTVTINGSASHPNFWKYEIHYGPEPNPSNQWVLIGVTHENLVLDGVLETWNTAIVPDGTYSLRLRVVRRDGNYEDYFVRQITVANTGPTETPTPETSVTPTFAPRLTNTPAPTQIKPTVIVAQPTIIQPTASPSPTGAAPQVAAPQQRNPIMNVLSGLGQALILGMGGMFGLVLLIGAMNFLRGIIRHIFWREA